MVQRLSSNDLVVRGRPQDVYKTLQLRQYFVAENIQDVKQDKRETERIPRQLFQPQ